MFKAHIESAIDALKDDLKFENAVFTEDPKFILSQIEGTQIVSYYSRDIQIDSDGCGGGFAFCYFDMILLVPESYLIDNVIWNVYSFFRYDINAISTDSRKIYYDIFRDDLQSDYKLIKFSSSMTMPIMRMNCCLEMDELC